MKTVFWLRLERKKLPGALAEQLCAILPSDAEEPDLLQWYLAERDPRLQVLQDCLRAAGYTPRGAGRIKWGPKEFFCLAQRQITRADMRQAEYLEPYPYRAVSKQTQRDRRGRLIVQSEYWQQSRFPIGSAGDGAIAVTSALREKMEKAGLQHLVFKETVVRGFNAKTDQGNWWELTSDLTLPPLQKDCRQTWAELGIKGGTGYVHVENPYRPALLHYRKADLAKVAPFDIGLIREELYSACSADAHLKRLVISQRFFRFCASQRLKLKGIPVRVD